MYLASHDGLVMKNYLMILSVTFSVGSLIYGVFNLPKLCSTEYGNKDAEMDRISKLNSLRPLCLNTNIDLYQG